MGVPPIIRQLILNDENLEIRITRRPDIRGFAEHVLEIVVRVLRIVLHDELDGDARGDLILFENRYIHSFRDISSPNGELFSEAESLRTDMIAFTQPPGQIGSDRTVKRLELFRTPRRFHPQEPAERVGYHLQKFSVRQRE